MIDFDVIPIPVVYSQPPGRSVTFCGQLACEGDLERRRVKNRKMNERRRLQAAAMTREDFLRELDRWLTERNPSKKVTIAIPPGPSDSDEMDDVRFAAAAQARIRKVEG